MKLQEVQNYFSRAPEYKCEPEMMHDMAKLENMISTVSTNVLELKSTSLTHLLKSTPLLYTTWCK